MSHRKTNSMRQMSHRKTNSMRHYEIHKATMLSIIESSENTITNTPPNLFSFLNS